VRISGLDQMARSCWQIRNFGARQRTESAHGRRKKWATRPP